MPNRETVCPACGNPELHLLVAQTCYMHWQRDVANEWKAEGPSGPELHCGKGLGCPECGWEVWERDDHPLLEAVYAELVTFCDERGISTEGQTLPTKEGQERLAI